ncbi:solute carrier family 22 member 23-like, partial [Amphibalanus amphitrite]|uniref:solute carrier family 22 member 23-like n=1 Tax=Amphibalanus amphitrite TaxID=1232801 RepID=UPI001C927F9C
MSADARGAPGEAPDRGPGAGREAAPDPDSVSPAPLPTPCASSASLKKSTTPWSSPPTFETLLESVGGFGLYQRALCVGLIGSSTFVCALTYYTQVLVLLAPPLRCVDGAGGSLPAGGACGSDGDPVQGDRSVTACRRWAFDTDKFFATITSENNWVCEDAWRPFVIHAVFWVGNIFGSWVWGTISDKLGRRPATLASFVLYSLFGAMTLLQPSSMAVLATIRFLVGTAHHTISHLPYML